MYVCMYVCIYIYTHLYICIYVYVYVIHIHKYVTLTWTFDYKFNNCTLRKTLEIQTSIEFHPSGNSLQPGRELVAKDTYT